MRKISSIDYWYFLMTNTISNSEKKTLINEMIKKLVLEYPRLCSLILERTCNLHCAHCFFQEEKSSSKISQHIDLESKILNITTQLPKNSSVIHEGRILQNWHIPILKKINNLRSDISTGLIDNGSYLMHEKSLRKNDFLFNWIDISLDGPKEIHNIQRQNDKAFDMAINGLKRAKEFIIPRSKGGKITSLFTATKINFRHLFETANLLMKDGLIDELHVTPASKVISKNNEIVIDDNNWSIFWKQFKKTKKLGDNLGVGVYLRLYQLEDVIKLSNVLGKKIFLKDFDNSDSVLVDNGSISFIVNNIRITYIPLSICSSETFVIDADGKYRLAYCIQYTLEELNRGLDCKGNNITPYTVKELKLNSDYKHLYEQGARQWISNFGNQSLEEELKFFNS